MGMLMTVFDQTRRMLMAGVLVISYTSTTHAGVDDTLTPENQFHQHLPVPGFGRTDWGFNDGEVEFYTGSIKVIAWDHVVIQKLYAEIGLENTSPMAGLRVFSNQLQSAMDKGNRQVILAIGIQLGCRKTSACSNRFQTNEKEVLVGINSMMVLVEPVRMNELEQVSTFQIDRWLAGDTIVGTINGIKANGLRKYLIRENYVEAEHLSLLDEYSIALDFQSTGGGTERFIFGVVKVDGRALIKFQIFKNLPRYGDASGSWSLSLSEVDAFNIPHQDFLLSTKAARLAAIVLARFFSQLLPMQSGFPDKSKFNNYVDTGTSLEITFVRLHPYANDQSSRVLEVDSHIELKQDRFKEAKLPIVQAF